MADETDVIVTVRQIGRQPLSVLLEGELVVGRDCDGLLLADSEVSRRHLSLRRMGPAVQITDLGSTNGTFVNGIPLTGSQTIDPTSKVTLGDTTLSIEIRSRRPVRLPPGATTTIRSTSPLAATSIDLIADTITTDLGSLGRDVFDGETISIVFSDIEASTRRATELGDRAWFRLLERHNQIFRRELARCGGREVKSIGDGFMLTFPSVRRALRFATRVQQHVEADEGPDLRVRMGIHTGEAIVDTSGDLFGRHVNLAARVANVAGGGQILASLVVHEIAAGRDDVAFGQPELATFEGFDEPQTVYEVLWRDTRV
jgi:class 3 adenylate cyclase